MGIIFTKQKCIKPKRKPGWQAIEAQNEAWLKSVNSVKLFASSKYRPSELSKRIVAKTPFSPVITGPIVSPDRLIKGASLGSIVNGGTKQVREDPHVVYRNDPAMLARELKARERKFCTAPAYNKGNDILMTEEMMKDVLSGATRRRN